MPVKVPQRRLNAMLVAAMLSCLCAGARADVTIEEKSSFDLAFIKANGVSTEQYVLDKKYRTALRPFRRHGWIPCRPPEPNSQITSACAT